MFAGLSGSVDITGMFLDAGAETDQVNSVGRTAAQMAAFVGQHDCVTMINNFFSRERLEYYTRPQGQELEPKLPPKLAAPLHKIIMTTNLNPVKMVMLVKESPLLAEVGALEKCYRVMDLLCEQQQDMNEVLAMKMHYISCVLQKCLSFLRQRDNKLDALVKSLLKGRDGDGFPQYQEKFIRDCIRKFPYCEATLLQQLVQNIAPVEIGNDPSAFSGDDPSAFSVLSQALSGQMVLMDSEFCSTCGERGAERRCSGCRMVIYCGQACQRLHWFTHKKVCRGLRNRSDSPRLREITDNTADDTASGVSGDTCVTDKACVVTEAESASSSLKSLRLAPPPHTHRAPTPQAPGGPPRQAPGAPPPHAPRAAPSSSSTTSCEEEEEPPSMCPAFPADFHF
ncbi:ankyrin repeat and MYND domain-containing protein 2-like [Engraulis encrasicolus]|uniref:ankyrin repeat and MYND domain-containing protein 2-like n=1 Tax=Engraulis encrasicolus TaxID=184585 RepID=UPI002FD713A9